MRERKREGWEEGGREESKENWREHTSLKPFKLKSFIILTEYTTHNCRLNYSAYACRFQSLVTPYLWDYQERNSFTATPLPS